MTGDNGNGDVGALFEALDRCRDKPPIVAKFLLERILYLDPELVRAQRLLDKLEGQANENPILRRIEEVEDLASQGMQQSARELAAQLQASHGTDPVARAWLEGIDLLWTDSPKPELPC